MNRRVFLQTAGGCAACALVGGCGSSGLTSGLFERTRYASFEEMPRPYDTKINVQFLKGQRIPKELHVGPCRANSPESWDRDAEVETARNRFASWANSVDQGLTPKAHALEPMYIEYAGDHRVSKADWKRIEERLGSVDVFAVDYRVPGLERYKKPIIELGNQCASMDVPAALRAQGHEAYGAYGQEELNAILSAMQVRKAMGETKVLSVTDGPWTYEYNTVRSNIPTDVLESRLGIGCKYLKIREFMDEFLQISADSALQTEARRITTELLGNAEAVHMKEEYVLKSVNYYLTAKRLMARTGCNAYTATCQEFCVSRNPLKYEITPCLTHTLLKDQAYPSACEGDLNVLAAIAMLTYLSGKSVHMGNGVVYKDNQEFLRLQHDVPGRKMKGFEEASVPYEIVPFTEPGWGATVRYDFGRDRGQPVTLVRWNPEATKVLVTSGSVEKAEGVRRWGCSLLAILRVRDSFAYFEKAQDFGHHQAMVYGDYRAEIGRLGEIMDFEVVEV